MFSDVRFLASAFAIALIPPLVHAQDVVIFASGQTVKGRVLRYEDNRFSILVSNTVKDVQAEDVHSVFFGIEESEAPWLPSTNATPVTTPATNIPSVPAPTNTPAPKAEPTAAEGNYTVGDLLARGSRLDGKIVKLEFDYCSVIREGKKKPYLATLLDHIGGIDVEFGKEAYAWFNQLPQHMVFLDGAGRKARAYYVYGIVAKSGTPLFVGGRQVEGCTFEPIGRKTKKGMRGALEYEW